jgi:hypothetical protein
MIYVTPMCRPLRLRTWLCGDREEVLGIGSSHVNPILEAGAPTSMFWENSYFLCTPLILRPLDAFVR